MKTAISRMMKILKNDGNDDAGDDDNDENNDPDVRLWGWGDRGTLKFPMSCN